MARKGQDIPQGLKILSDHLSSLAHLRSSRREIHSYKFTKCRDFALLADFTCVEAAVTAVLREQTFFYGALSDNLFALSPPPPEDLGLQQDVTCPIHDLCGWEHLVRAGFPWC